MSIDRCRFCDQLIDTDDDPDCYWELPVYDSTAIPTRTACICVCDTCREKYVAPGDKT